MTSATGFIGLSHLGIIMSTAWAAKNGPVLAVDTDSDTVSRMSLDTPPIHEPGLPELLEETRGRRLYTTGFAALSECPLVLITRDVPTDDENQSNIEPVRALIREAIPHLHQDVELVLMSQVSPWMTRSIAKEIQTVRPELRFSLYYWVETLIFGNAVQRALEPERFIIGCSDPAAPLPEPFATGLAAFNCPILPMTYESAELTKTAINLYLVGSVTYANMLSDLCESIGADWSEMIPALKLDKRIGPAAYIRPSLGVAGGNLERDLVTLKKLGTDHDVPTIYLDALIQANGERFDWVTRHLERHVLNAASKPRLSVWGLTYKKDTRSTKNSPALRLIEWLGNRALIQAWDPVITELDLNIAILPTMLDALTGADALVIMADWDVFAGADLEAVRTRLGSPLIIDCVGILEQRQAEMAGIQYVSMGHAGVVPSPSGRGLG